RRTRHDFRHTSCGRRPLFLPSVTQRFSGGVVSRRQHGKEWSTKTRRRRTAVLVASALLLVGGATDARADSGTGQPRDGLRQVMFVGNNWDGTADVIEPQGEMSRIGRVNVVPDKKERLREISTNPVKLLFFLGVRYGP